MLVFVWEMSESDETMNGTTFSTELLHEEWNLEKNEER